MKKQSLNDFQFSIGVSKTQVSVTKVLFHSEALPYVEKAVGNIMEQLNVARERGIKLTGLAQSRIPFSIFPHIEAAMERYSGKNAENIRQENSLYLYHKHYPIGKIMRDDPKKITYCVSCGREIVVGDDNKPQCPEHGENVKTKTATL